MQRHGQCGSALVATMLFIVLVTLLAGLVLELSLNTFRLTMRNQLQATARAVAESELEHIYYQFASAIIGGASGDEVAASLTEICDQAETPSTDREAYLETSREAGWTVRRSIVKAFGPALGVIPDTTKLGRYTYFIARVEVVPPPDNAFGDAPMARVGRRFMNSSTSVFQYSVFFQGDLELNPGSDTTIEGDIVVNGSIYMGPRFDEYDPEDPDRVLVQAALTITDKIRYLRGHHFNTDADGNPGQYHNPEAPEPSVNIGPPTYNVNKVEVMDKPENLLGVIDPRMTAEARPDLFGPAPPAGDEPETWTPEELEEAENNVHRSLLAPPPSAAGSGEYANATAATGDDPVIGVRRAYNKAGLILTIEGDTVTFTEGPGGPPISLPGVVSAPSAMHDYREGKDIRIVNVDVAALTNALDGVDFNGLLYVNLKDSSAATPAAVRLINGSDLNQVKDTGFSVATNGGLYVQGSYNTVPDSGDPTRNISAMLMADAITALSESWDDANAAGPLSDRVAGESVTINAGLLTGNVSSTINSTSGGAQNLVRYLENWSGKSVTVSGSMGRLFASTHFTAPFAGGAGTVYLQPDRVFNFDENLPKKRPPGSPESTAFSRGSFFSY